MDRIDYIKNNMDEYTSREYIIDNVFPKLLPMDRVCEDSVYFPFLDLAVMFYVRIDKDYTVYTTSYTINENALLVSGLSKSDIYRYALGNLALNIRIVPLDELLTHAGFEEFEKTFIPILCISNPNGYYGAACMMVEDIRYIIGDILGEPYIILPSSVHEVLACPVGMVEDLNSYSRMVYDVNRTQVEPKDKLSDSVYICENGGVDVYKGDKNGQV